MTSSSWHRDLAPALDALPLSPLPQTVLFPGALLPLHIFEPRYCELVRDVLDSHRSLAVVLITDAATMNKYGQPSIAPVAGVGTVVDTAELPGGRYNILLRGRARVALEELPFVPPYRRAEARLVQSIGEVGPNDLAALLSTANAFAALVRECDPKFEFRLPRDAPAALIADLCAHHLVLDARKRQSLLEMVDVGERVRELAEVLAVQRISLSPERRDVN